MKYKLSYLFTIFVKFFGTSFSVLFICVACSSSIVFDKQTVPKRQSSILDKFPESDVSIQTKFWLERINRNPYDPISRIKAGTSLLLLARETGNHSLYPEAELILRESLTIGSGSYDALVMLAFALTGQHRFSEAATIAKQALEVNPYKETAWAAWGDAELEKGNLIKAKEAYTQLLQFDRSLFSLTRWANLAISEGNISVALASLDEGAKIGLNRGVAKTEIARSFIQMGEIHFQHGEFEQAKNHYQQALALWPNGYLPMEHIAELKASENELGLSIKDYSEIIKIAPHPDLLESYASVLERMDKPIEAQQFYQKAFEKYLEASNNGDPSYFRHLAFFYTDIKKKPKLALVWAKKDLALRPVPQSYVTLAWVLYHMGSYKLAEQTMDKALINERSLNAIWLYRAGVIYQQSTKKELVKRLLNKALKLNPKHPETDLIKKILQKV